MHKTLSGIFIALAWLGCIGCTEDVKNAKPLAPSGCAEGVSPFAYAFTGPLFTASVTDFVVQDPHIYFTDRLGGHVLSLPIEGGDLVPWAAGENSPSHIAVDQANLYWATETEIRRMALTGGPPVTLASSIGTPQCIALDASYVYWTTSLARLMRVAIDGSETKELVDGSATAFAFVGVALDDTHIYWASHGVGGTNDDSVLKMPKEGGPLTTLATGQSFPWRIAVNENHVYWTNVGDFNTNVGLMKVAIAGGETTTMLSTQSPTYANYAALAGVFVNAQGVYATSTGTQEYDHYNGALMKLPREGGASTTLASAVRKAQDKIVVRDCRVFYAADGKLLRIDGDI